MRRPEIEPHAHGMLDVGDGHRIHWEECGNPAGKPAVVLHGGPGGGCGPQHRGLFDPEAYRIILFDQRSCGRSTPHASEPGAGLAHNTIGHLLTDLELLRCARGVEKWLVLGGSWGSTLALAYAQRHRDRVSEIVVASVATLRRRELDWLYGGGAGMFFPEAWTRFLAPVPPAQRDGDLIEAYHRLLADPATRDGAVDAWCAWETATLGHHAPGPDPFADRRYATAFVRIVNHYFRHQGWLAEGELLAHAGKLAGLPGVIVQGRDDMQTPPGTAWELARAWPDAELILVDDAGHSSATLAEHLVRATDGFASTWHSRG